MLRIFTNKQLLASLFPANSPFLHALLNNARMYYRLLFITACMQEKGVSIDIIPFYTQIVHFLLFTLIIYETF